MKVRLIVPRRADGGERDRLWVFCRRWWQNHLPDLEIVEGAHEEGPFNRGAALNQAAAGDWDIAIVCDADVVATPEQVRAAIANAAETGRATLAYDRYVGLTEQMTARVLAGFDGTWERGAKLRMETHVSSLVAVPRALWDQVRGFDERFVGWGYEDAAFADTCRVIGGGIDRIPGTVWHLWHAYTPERKKSRQLTAGALLAQRYHENLDPAKMRAFIDERLEPDGVVLIVITDGRRDCIERTLTSAAENLKGLPIVRRVICDDSGDIDFAAWLRCTFPDFEIRSAPKRSGFAGAVRRGIETAIGSGQRFIYWLEDDFTHERPVDLRAMADVLDANPHLVQMALRRQAWFPKELEAGGVIEQDPDAYEQRDGWLEHAKFWTTNPHLTTRNVLVAHEWPNQRHSEAMFAREVLTGERRSGYWGMRDDPPAVLHIGETRVGTFY